MFTILAWHFLCSLLCHHHYSIFSCISISVVFFIFSMLSISRDEVSLKDEEVRGVYVKLTESENLRQTQQNDLKQRIAQVIYIIITRYWQEDLWVQIFVSVCCKIVSRLIFKRWNVGWKWSVEEARSLIHFTYGHFTCIFLIEYHL